MRVTFGSVCSGIEAASVAWHHLGWHAVWLAEIDRAASEVLAYRFPDVPNLGDMTLLAGKIRRREIPAPDVLVGGTPCQAFSVAGLRGGLSDERGQLTLAFVLLADAIDEVRYEDGLDPVIIVWENVPGVLNHKDNPFGCFLAGLAGEDDQLQPAGRKWTNAGAVCGPERAIAWRTLDAQYFGLAQRRRRVFVVASAREGFDPVAILLEFDGVRRDSAPSREAGEDVAGALDARAAGGGFPGTDGACAGHVVADIGRLGTGVAVDLRNGVLTGDVTQTIQAGAHAPDPGGTPHVLTVVHGTQDPCSATDVGFALGRNSGQENVICFSSKDYGADATDDLSPTLRAGGHADSHANVGVPPAVVYAIQERAVCENPNAGPDGMGVRDDDCAYTLEARAVPQAVAFVQNSRSEVRLMGGDGQVVGALVAETGVQQQQQQCYIAYPIDNNALRGDTVALTPSPDAEGRVRLRDPGFGVGSAGDPSPTLQAGPPPAVCVTGSVTHTLRAEGFDASEDGTGRGQPIVAAVALRGREGGGTAELGDDLAGCLRASGGGGDKPHALVDMAVRRLMPVECERLQGFPDNWTLVPNARGKLAADGPRYKQCGNSMATNVMRWIGSRIAAALQPSMIGHNGGPTLDPSHSKRALLAALLV